MNPLAGLSHMLDHAFFQNALLAGTAVAFICGLVGFFVVLRTQVFAGDAMSHVAYTGAVAALAAGVDLRLGLFASTIVVGVVLGLLGGRSESDDVVIGVVFSWILGLGVFFLAWYTTHNSAGGSSSNVKVLFGSIFGIARHDAAVAVIIAAVLVVILLAIARPLLFSSVDPAVAAARGVPVRLLSIVFLALLGATAAEGAQIIGSLLLLGLLAAPPAAARLLTDRPWRAFWLSGLLAVAAVWIGLVIAYAAPRLPPSFTIMTVAVAEYALAGAWFWVRGHRLTRREERVAA